MRPRTAHDRRVLARRDPGAPGRSGRRSRPGPGALPSALLRALADRGRAADRGDARRRLPLEPVYGDGVELAQVRPYVPGDDVRKIEWNVTARTGVPHVRVHLAERVLVTWLVLDTRRRCSSAPPTGARRTSPTGVALALGHVATRRGNRLGVVTFGDGEEDAAAGAGPHGLVGLLSALPVEPQATRSSARASSARPRRFQAASRSRSRRASARPRSARRSPAPAATRPAARARRRRLRLPRPARLAAAAARAAAAGTTCSRSRCATRASRCCPTSASSGSSTRRPAARCASTRAARRSAARFAAAAAEERSGVARVPDGARRAARRPLDRRRLAAHARRLPAGARR